MSLLIKSAYLNDNDVQATVASANATTKSLIIIRELYRDCQYFHVFLFYPRTGENIYCDMAAGNAWKVYPKRSHEDFLSEQIPVKEKSIILFQTFPSERTPSNLISIVLNFTSGVSGLKFRVSGPRL